MSRKRDKPYTSRHNPATVAKRRRPLPPPPPEPELDKPISKPAPPPGLVVMGLSADCSVLDLKSRFEIYGSISRIRIDRDGVGYVAYRTKDSAEAAVAASLDPSFGITVQSQRVQVLWATDPLAKWREGVVHGANKDNGSSSSKLLRAEVPLRRHGRGNKLASAIVNPKSADGPIANPKSGDGASAASGLDEPFRGREIIAYDDIL
ncbi:Splicing factor-like protein [Trema orientale]|uniref:Splicing factor-like protein n=1 Tax=Trema orientale TaxID=63057 RepID=A0A2P5FQG8_TREOI|nr:Splicing factor-like protein [Trema orientale]